MSGLFLAATRWAWGLLPVADVSVTGTYDFHSNTLS